MKEYTVGINREFVCKFDQKNCEVNHHCTLYKIRGLTILLYHTEVNLKTLNNNRVFD